MGFIEVMRERQMLAQITHEDELITHLKEKPRAAYAGFDPTAESLHVGHLLPVLALRRFQQAGHRVIALMGGATAMVGDPTGKTEMRQMISEETIDANIVGFKKQISRFLDFSSPDKGIIVNNADWFRDMNYLSFLRETGSQFSVNRMLGAECFKSRLETGLSFLEFNYMVLQSYDFYYLKEKYDCTLQLGGDDQWSNMLGGIDLIRRKSGDRAYCLTVPLLVSPSGKKMGKTEQGAIWIDPDLTPPYDLFQYFRNVEDEMVATCLYYFTDLPVDEIAGLTAKRDQSINDAKVILATEATRLMHGDEEAAKAREAATSLFGGAQAGADAPEVLLDGTAFGDQRGLLDVLVDAGIAPSRGEARRLVQQGGLSLNGEKVEDSRYEIPVTLLKAKDGLLVKKGKKHYYRLRIS